MEAFLRLDDLKGPPIYELEENIHVEIAVIPVDMLKMYSLVMNVLHEHQCLQLSVPYMI